MNSDTFEVVDLEKLTQRSYLDIQEHRNQRKAAFKEHEIEKEHDRRKKIGKLPINERIKLEEIKKINDEKKKQHPRVNYPGHRQHFENVWNTQDHLEREKFDPIKFFKLHGI